MASYTLEECDAIVNILAQELKNIRQAISNQAVFPSTKQPDAKEEAKEAKPVQEKKVKNG
jgi:hypothetical protein